MSVHINCNRGNILNLWPKFSQLRDFEFSGFMGWEFLVAGCCTLLLHCVLGSGNFSHLMSLADPTITIPSPVFLNRTYGLTWAWGKALTSSPVYLSILILPENISFSNCESTAKWDLIYGILWPPYLTYIQFKGYWKAHLTMVGFFVVRLQYMSIKKTGHANCISLGDTFYIHSGVFFSLWISISVFHLFFFCPSCMA